MALEYEDLTIAPGNTPETVLNARAADGWRVHTAFSPTHFLLEKGSASRPSSAPSVPPTGTKG